MNWLSIPVFMSASVSFYVGFYYLWMYFRRRSEREQLSFAVTCFIVSAYDLFCGGLYNAQSLAEGMFWQRFQFASLALLSIAVLWFLFDFSHYRIGRLFYIIAGYFFILFILGLAVRNELTLSLDHPMLKPVRLGNYINITYQEVDPGIIYLVQYVSMMAGYVWILYLIVKDLKSGNRNILPLLVAFVIFFIAAVNDVLVGAAVYPFIYLIEYAYIIIILSMAQVLMNRYVQLQIEVEELNRDLEKKVEERTEELHAAMEELEAINDRLVHTNAELEEAQRVASLDMAMAAGVQESLFPKEPPASDEWDVAFVYLPKAGVSGDLYDFYVHDNRLQGLSLFDVSGHGISAGIFTLLAKSILGRNFTRMKDAGLGKVVENVNADLKSDISSVDNYLSGIMLRFRDDRVEYVNAGHHALLMRRAGTGKAGMVKPQDRDQRGAILGMDDIGGDFDVVRFRMATDDVLLLYTDGLDESFNETGKQYGRKRIIESLENAPAGPARAILDHIMDEFYRFLGLKPPGDDCTVIVIRRLI